MPLALINHKKSTKGMLCKVKGLCYGIIVIYLGYIAYKIINEGIFGSISWSWLKFFGFMLPLLFVAIWFYAKEKKNLTFIFVLIFSASIVYFYTYNLQYEQPFWENNIDSEVYIQKSQNFTFDQLDAYLTFSNSGATMRETIKFSNKNTSANTTVETTIKFNPPNNTVNYEVNISGKTLKGENKTLVQEKDIISNDSLNYSNLNFVSGTYEIVVEYKIKDIKPTGRVLLWIQGDGDYKPKIKKIWSQVKINQIKYKCLEPCVLAITKDSLAYPPRGHITEKEPVYIFDVEKTETDELGFLLWTTERVYPGLRNLIFAFIVGLLASAISILINDRDNYLKEFTGYLDGIKRCTNIIHTLRNLLSHFLESISGYLDMIKRCITDIIHTLRNLLSHFLESISGYLDMIKRCIKEIIHKLRK